MELYKQYELKNGEIISFDGFSTYDINRVPIEIFTSSKYHGAWNKKGKYLTNVYFMDNDASEMDVLNGR